MTNAITNGISQSQINLYRSCPYAYKLKYVDGLEPMMFTRDFLDIGKYIHDAIEVYYKNLYDTDTNPESIYKSTYSVLRENWDHTLLPEYLKKANICLQNFGLLEYENMQENKTEPESEGNYTYDDFRAKLDYFRRIPLLIGDFKSSTKPIVYYDYKIQAAVYLYVMRHKLDLDIDDFYFWYLYPNIVKKVKWDDLQKVLEDAKKYRDEIKDAFDSMEFKKKPRTKSTCKYCDYKYYCVRGF